MSGTPGADPSATLDETTAELLAEHLSGGLGFSEEMRTEFEAILHTPLLNSYVTMAGDMVCADPLPPAKRKPGTVGLVEPGVLVVRSYDGEPVRTGENGEVLLQNTGPNSNLPEQTNGVLQQPAEEATGDTGFIDEDGFLTITRWSAQAIRRGGEIIPTGDLEEALVRGPFAQEAAAFGVPHARLGSDVGVAVVLKPEAYAEPSWIVKLLTGRIAQFKLPSHIVIVPELPRDSAGRIAREMLPRTISQVSRPVTDLVETLEFQIQAIWQRILKRQDIGAEDNFFDAGGDSLMATTMLLEVEELTRHALPQSELREALTIRQLSNAIRCATSSQTGFVTCAKSGSGTPFFYCHGDFGSRGFYALKLADMIDLDIPFYLLHSPSTVDELGGRSIEDLADAYLPEILALQLQGPIRLGGYCHGGQIAWELAQRLDKMGREIECVTLIDVVSTNARRFPRLIWRFAKLFPRTHGGQRLLREIMVAVWEWLEWLNAGNRKTPARLLRKFSATVRGARAKISMAAPWG